METLNKVKSLVIIGASGVGKGTIIKQLKQRYKGTFQLVLSFTTRPMRPKQTHGVDYYFVSHQQFNSKINQMLEFKLVHKNWYGTSLAHLDYLRSLNKIPILDVDIQGMLEIKKKIDCEVLCIMPASWDLLKDRLEGRKTESPQVVEGRMRQNKLQIEKMLTLQGMERINFVTNYQYQLTTFGVEKWLQKKYQRFVQVKKQKDEQNLRLLQNTTTQ